MATKNTTFPLAKNTSGVAEVAIGGSAPRLMAVPWVTAGLWGLTVLFVLNSPSLYLNSD